MRTFRSEAGFSLIEVSVVMVLLSASALALLGTLARLPLLDKSQDEEVIALQAAQTKIEELEIQAQTDFGSLWVRFNTDPADDPPDGVSPGSDFSVIGLLPGPDNPGGFCGQVVFPETDGLLDETVDWGEGGHEIDAVPGMDSTSISAEDYRLLPVKVEIRFVSATGQLIVRALTTTIYGNR